jgi:zinc/manganese transport system substrate-binding protein
MMKKILTIVFVILAFAGEASYAKLKIVVSYPYIRDITERIGEDKVSVEALGKGDWDPHFVVPRPSFIARARDADLLIINGAQLEIGWMPPIINQSNNPKIVPGQNGLLDLSTFIALHEVPTNVSRSMGDVHPGGNPHFLMDPSNVPVIASAIAQKLSSMDPANSSVYKKNNDAFAAKWKTKLKEWDEKMKPLRGVKVFQYHKLYDYLLERYGIIDAGNLEPLPGIPPTSKHIEDLIGKAKRENVHLILQDVYHPYESSKYLESKTGAKMIVIPHDVQAVREATDIFSLFDAIVKELMR